MFTIIDIESERVLFSKFDNIVLEGQIAIPGPCSIDREEGKDLYYSLKENYFYNK